MLDCRRCENWQDESFAQLYQENRAGHQADSFYYGCRIYGMLEIWQLESCDHYRESKELFTVCSSCGIATPKICVSLGECVNCTDTDLYCVDNCRGEGEKKFCTHFQRLRREGHTLIENNRCFEVFPESRQPAGEKAPSTPVITILPGSSEPETE